MYNASFRVLIYARTVSIEALVHFSNSNSISDRQTDWAQNKTYQEGITVPRMPNVMPNSRQAQQKQIIIAQQRKRTRFIRRSPPLLRYPVPNSNTPTVAMGVI
jgi:hypothetical protein